MSPRISREEVAHVARLARLALSEEELDLFAPQLAAVLDYAAEVAALDTHGVAPTAHPLPILNVLRSDVPVECLNRDVVLAQAPETRDGRFMVPRIMAQDS